MKQEFSWSTASQLLVFGLCGDVDRNVGIGIPPEIEKSLIGADCRGGLAHRTLGSRELERGRGPITLVRQAAPEHDFLKLDAAALASPACSTPTLECTQDRERR